MSVFSRFREQAQADSRGENRATEPTPTAPAPSYALPTTARPATPAAYPASKDAAMSLPPKPATPSAPSPGLMPPRPGMVPQNPGMGTMGQPQRQQPAAEERRTLVIGRGISLAGTVADAERLVIEGTMESQMLQAAELFITATGTFKGEVQVQDAEIAGVFDGTLTVRGALVIRASGRIIGVARCGRLQVEDGGQLSGRMEMLGDGTAAAPGAPAPAAPRPVAADLSQG
ncbi:cytoskeletal protein CcmA (bactofilin family) [Humitalea rosea]|uniref:Cytoskeletal protein CcmA (Bactofilin family) n=2 Tax=Humitalea rosea TaxID=990373 RepID=A0A2W7ILX2_9PROT|nr:cytoskeletal protein CcmA (bactofilin family) [Humitalea rosea]